MSSEANYPSVIQQQDLCANLCIAKKLRGPVLHIPGSSSNPSRKSSVGRTEQKLCDSLSWIALTFIREAKGRDVAVCLYPTTTIELLIADNKGSKKRPSDKEVTDSLSEITTLALKASRKAKVNHTVYEPETDNVYKKTIEIMIRLNWDRMGRKMEKISSVLRYHRPTGGLQKFLEAQLEDWIANRKAREQPTEMFTALEKGSSPDISPTNGDQNDCLLKNALSGIFELSERITSTSKNDRERIVKASYQKFIKYCTYIDYSDFLNSCLGSDSLDQASRYPFIKMRRRIRNLIKYNTGAHSFLKHGIKYIQQYVGEREDLNGLLKFTFIGDSTSIKMDPQKVTWPTAPTIPNVPGASFWKDGMQLTAHVHCEVAMIYFIVNQRLSLRVIGTSTLTCSACRMFVDAVAGQGRWKLPPESMKDQYDWLMISTDTSNPMNVCFKTVYSRVEERAQTFLSACR